MSSPDATQSTALSTNADPETLIPRQQERLKPLHRATNATDRIPEQTEEDMDVVRNLAREMKREFMQANKDRQEVNRSRTRSVEAYEKLEQVSSFCSSARFYFVSSRFVVVVVVVVFVCAYLRCKYRVFDSDSDV
jgi:hypothetical protein